MNIQEILAKIDYSQTQEEILKQIKTYKTSFLPFVLTMYESVKPIKGSKGYSMFNSVKEMPDVITNINGVQMSNFNLGKLILFVSTTSRSKLFPPNKVMTKYPRMASMTPLFLYAQKLANGIKYEEWDKEDIGMEHALGGFLKPLLLPFDKDILELDKESIKELRTQYCSTGISKYKCTWVGVKHPFKYMILQSWLCNASIRDTESMILDPANWDNIPEALDLEVKKEIW